LQGSTPLLHLHPTMPRFRQLGAEFGRIPRSYTAYKINLDEVLQALSLEVRVFGASNKTIDR
jgi:hypothetical protein